MHHLGRASAAFGLLCLVSWPRPRDAFVVHRPGPDHTRTLNMFAFVLTNNVPWRPVLQQRIKLDALHGSPLYHDERTEAGSREQVKLVDGQVDLIAPLPVLRKVLGQYSWLGSHVDFAARVLSTAFSCFTYQNVSMVVEMILLMEYRYEQELTKYPAGIHQHRKDVLMDALSAFVLLMDKLASVHGDMDLLANVLYEYDESVFSVKKVQINVIGVLKKEIDNRIEKQCEVQLQETVLKNLGFTTVVGSLTDSKTTLYLVKKAIDKIIERLLVTYDSFRIESLPLENWSQILDYQTAVSKNINPYVISPDAVLDDSILEILSQAKSNDGGDEQTRPFEIGTSSDEITNRTDDGISEEAESSTNVSTESSGESSAEPGAEQSIPTTVEE